MILKVTSPQSILDHHKRDLNKSKDGLIMKKTASFASVLGRLLELQPN